MLALAIFIGAGIGGLARYSLGAWVQAGTGAAFPWSTLFVNVTGSLLLAFVYVLLEGTTAPPEWRAFVGVGVLGGYTTFSAFSFETVRLLQGGEVANALIYMVASVLASVAAAFAGLGLALLLLRNG